MPPPAVLGATLACSFGAAPGTLMVLPTPLVMIESRPAATIFDNVFPINITGFAVCASLANPATAALTTAASGVLTPGPCTPTVPAPWTPGAPTTLIGGKPALTLGSVCNCVFGGVINIVNPGSTLEQFT